MTLVNVSRSSGFSLIELIAVIILLGILGVVALGRFTGGDAFAARGFFDDTVSAVRFAQKLAISSGCDVRVAISGTGYQLFQSSSCTTSPFDINVRNPANRANDYVNNNIPAGYTLNAGTITFTASGQRENATSAFTLSGGPTPLNFRVHQDTGLVEVF